MGRRQEHEQILIEPIAILDQKVGDLIGHVTGVVTNDESVLVLERRCKRRVLSSSVTAAATNTTACRENSTTDRT